MRIELEDKGIMSRDSLTFTIAGLLMAVFILFSLTGSMFGINLTDLAILLALGGLIAAYFGWRGQLRVGIQIALVIVVGQFALSWLAVVVLAVLRYMSGGD